MSLHLADVAPPSGRRHSHHLVRMPSQGAGAVVVNGAGSVLLVYRHRFIPDSFGWELPAGRIDPGETPERAAAREVREETGWTVHSVRRLCSIHPSPGISDQLSHVVTAVAGERAGQPDTTSRGYVGVVKATSGRSIERPCLRAGDSCPIPKLTGRVRFPVTRYTASPLAYGPA